MKKVVIKSLTLTNFRGAAYQEIRFNDTYTLIKGRNGLGKSRILDAVLILLTFQDRVGAIDFQRNPVFTRNEDGTIQHDLPAIIEASFDIDGTEAYLKREFKEKPLKEGETEKENRGTESTYYINSASKSTTQGKYKEFVEENFTAIDTIKVLFNLNYFFDLTPDKMRNKLFEITGEVPEITIAERKAEYMEIYKSAQAVKNTVSEYRSGLTTEINRLTKDIEKKTVEIEQTQKLKADIKVEDWAEMEKQLDEIKLSKDGLNKQISLQIASNQPLFDKEQEKAQKIKKLTQQLNDLVLAEEQRLSQAYYTNNATRNQILNDITITENKIKSEQSLKAEAIKQADFFNGQAKIQEDESDKAAFEWENLKKQEQSNNAERLSQCQYYSEACPFFETKSEALDKIVKRGTEALSRKTEYLAKAEEYRTKIAEYDANIQTLENTLTALKKQLADTPVIDKEDLDRSKIQGYAEIEQQIKDLQNETITDTKEDVIIELKERIADCEAKEKQLLTALAGKDTIKKFDEAVATLESEKNRLQETKNQKSREHSICTDYLKEVITTQSDKINNQFKNIRFQLFETTTDGKVNECCRASINGVPYATKNDAAKINAQLEINEVLSQYYKISLPVFVDNAERVNELIKTSGQRIELKVSEDKELVISE